MDTELAPLSAERAFAQSIVVEVLNPKTAIFFLAFLPQFVDPSRGQALQYSVLVATFAGCELFWYVMYAAGGHGLRRWLAKPFARRWFGVEGVTKPKLPHLERWFGEIAQRPAFVRIVAPPMS